MTPPATAAAHSHSARRSLRVTGIPRASAVAVPPIAVPRSRPGTARRSTKRSRAADPTGLLGQMIGTVARVSEHRLLDRLIRGRIWIGLVAFALIGIVAMQLAVLKFNTGIGQSLQRVAQLQRENAAISIEDSTRSAGEDVELEAAHKGMVMVPIATIHFLRTNPGEIARAASTLGKPIPAESSVSASSASPAVSSPTAQAGSEMSTEAAGESEISSAQANSTAETASESPSPAVSVSSHTTEEPTSQPESPQASISAGGGTQAAPAG